MRMMEVGYSELMQQLQAAGLAGTRIEATDKDRWRDYVREHRVKEAACRVHAKGLAAPLRTVIIDDGGKWDGYYVYSSKDEVALKFSLD